MRSGFEPAAAGWKAKTNPLGYGHLPRLKILASFRPFQD